MASPAFYFLFALIHQQPLSTSTVRALTGTLRIVPFMGLFYAGFAVVGPFTTAYFMRKGQSYDDAQGTAGVALMLGGLCWVRAA